jgi:DNA modification methylase
MTAKKIKLSSIKPNPDNPRIVKNDKFYKLVESIKQFGNKMFPLRPIVVDENRIILGGNMRHKALKHLKYKEVPNTWIKQADELTEDEKKEFIIKDNVGFGAWDWDVLSNEWDANLLDSWGLDIPDFEVEELDAQEDNYKEPEQMQIDVVLGDLIEMGEHRLLCGNSTDSDAVDKLMNGEKADMVFTDPPYGMNFQSNFREKTPQFSKIENDDKILDISPILYLHLKDNSPAYICTRWDLYPVWYNQVAESFNIKNCVVWYKKGGGLGDLENSYAPNHEFIIVGHKGKAKLKGKREADVWEIGRDSNNNYNHPTQKPLELPSFAIKNHSNQNDLILDLFLGSGSTMAAAHQLNRTCYGMELDPKYCQVIIDRMQKLDSSIKVKINNKEYKQEEIYF